MVRYINVPMNGVVIAVNDNLSTVTRCEALPIIIVIVTFNYALPIALDAFSTVMLYYQMLIDARHTLLDGIMPQGIAESSDLSSPITSKYFFSSLSKEPKTRTY